MYKMIATPPYPLILILIILMTFNAKQLSRLPLMRLFMNLNMTVINDDDLMSAHCCTGMKKRTFRVVSTG